MSLTQQELDALHGGMIAGGTIARRDAQIAAFGAIRRAAEVARRMEELADSLPANQALEWNDKAIGARAAIRAAIGAKKVRNA